jgi:hypothetical protein
VGCQGETLTGNEELSVEARNHPQIPRTRQKNRTRKVVAVGKAFMQQEAVIDLDLSRRRAYSKLWRVRLPDPPHAQKR